MGAETAMQAKVREIIETDAKRNERVSYTLAMRSEIESVGASNETNSWANRYGSSVRGCRRPAARRGGGAPLGAGRNGKPDNKLSEDIVKFGMGFLGKRVTDTLPRGRPTERGMFQMAI